MAANNVNSWPPPPLPNLIPCSPTKEAPCSPTSWLLTAPPPPDLIPCSPAEEAPCSPTSLLLTASPSCGPVHSTKTPVTRLCQRIFNLNIMLPDMFQLFSKYVAKLTKIFFVIICWSFDFFQLLWAKKE